MMLPVLNASREFERPDPPTLQAPPLPGFTRICLTPTRNEAWIIEAFLAAARAWADLVVVADQGSTDGTFEQAVTAPKVAALRNEDPRYDEAARQELLVNRARQMNGRRILIALDADEVLSANALQSDEWDKIAAADPGTILRFRWVNILPGFERAWIPREPAPLGVIDDGTAPCATRIHSRRVPARPDAPVLDLEEIVVLHFQYVVPGRVRSKHRWYQAWELLNQPHRGALDIFRQYNHMHGSWDADELHPLKPEWLEGYSEAGLNFQNLRSEENSWWDREVFNFLCQHGTERFRKLDIWDKDWASLAAACGRESDKFVDPRSRVDRAIHHLLKKTQSRREAIAVRAFERFLRLSGW